MRRLLACLVLLAAVSGGANAQEVIHRFDSLVQVARDGTLTVTETIAVRAEGREIKRGIYRDFPLTFRDLTGHVRQVTFRLDQVRRDGKPENYFTRMNWNGIRIYAGREDVILKPGNYTYTLIYRSGRQLRWFDEGAELFWNVTGNEWNFPIARAGVRVVLEGGTRVERWTAYSGRYGERGTDWKGGIAADGSLHVETTRTLGAKEGFSIVAAIPATAVDPPSRAQRLAWFFMDYRSWVFAALGLGLVGAYYSFAWNAVGRDPKRGTIIPLFYPPEGISPALANYVHNWGLGRDLWRAFTAASLSLAVRGLILFDEKDGSLTLKATGKAPGTGERLPPGERAVYDWVTRSQSGVAAIERANGPAVAKIGKEFKELIEKENRDKFFRKNLGYFFAGLTLTAVVILGVLMFGGMRQEDLFILIFAGFACVWLGLFLIPLVIGIVKGVSSGSAFHISLIIIFLLFFIFLGGSQLLSQLQTFGSEVFPYFLGVIVEHSFPFILIGGFAAVNGLFLYLLRAPTDIGVEVMDKIEGLRMYLQTAEAARLNMNAPEITTERFETLLPYAVALGVEKPWAEAFEAALKRAHPGEAMPQYRPRWGSGNVYSANAIGNAVSSSVTAATSAFSTALPPSSSGSSGFSGGGGSGGGGGGGGGGGW